MGRNLFDVRQDMKRIEQSFHVKAYTNMRQLSLSFFTFNKNYILFKNHLDANNNIDYFIRLNPSEKRLKWEYHDLEKETYRLLLNFVASALALVEHTRNIVKELYDKNEFQLEYQNKVNDEISNIPVNKFMQDFRNYILHNKLPFVSPKIQGNRISSIGDSNNVMSFKIQLTLNKQQLLKSEKFTALSKQYLKSQDEQIFLDVLADEYFTLIDNFHSWLNKCQREMHESDYSWLLDQWNELYNELESAMPHEE